MRVLAHSRSLPASDVGHPFELVGLEELFARADAISLRCPLTAETAGLVNARRLALVKQGAFRINMARGRLVVEEDLALALNDNRLASTAVDVVSREARRRLLDATVANVASFLAGRLTNVVNGTIRP